MKTPVAKYFFTNFSSIRLQQPAADSFSQPAVAADTTIQQMATTIRSLIYAFRIGRVINSLTSRSRISPRVSDLLSF